MNILTKFQEGEKKMALKEETAKDLELSAPYQLILEEWPTKRSSVPDNLKDYWNYRDHRRWHSTQKPQVHSAKEPTVGVH